MDKLPDSLVTVRVGKSWFGLPAAAIVEVCDLTHPTPLPRAPDHIAGLLSLRGHAIALLDLARFLRLPAAGGEQEIGAGGLTPKRVVIVEAAGMRVGMVIDQVRVLSEVPPDQWREAPSATGSQVEAYAQAGLDQPGAYVTLIDLAKLLEAARIAE